LVTRTFSLFTLFACLLASGTAAWAASSRGGGLAARLQQAKALRTRARQSLAAAAAEYRAALRQEPRNLEAERGLARVLRDQGAEEEALPYLRDVAERSGQSVDEARLAWALFRAGRWAESAEAFTQARERGQNDPETVQGERLAVAAARVALAPRDGSGSPSAAAPTAAAAPGGWQGVWSGLLNATGFIAGLVQQLLFAVIALLIAGGIGARVWGTLMGRTAPLEGEGIPLRRWRGLRVHELATGRGLGRVRRVIYDPKLGRVVGVQVGGRWRWRVLPLTAARGVGPAGLLVADADALVRGDQAGELGALAKAGRLPLGSGRGLKRVVTEEGVLLAFARPHRLWIDGATGQVSFEVSPSRFHDACRVTLSALQIGPLDWIMGQLLDQGLMLLPGRLSARLRLPASLVRSADRGVVIVSGEAADWIEQHFQRLEAEAHGRLAQVKEGVAKARPVVQAGVAKARPVLEKARDSGVALARRSAEAVATAGRKGAVAGSAPAAVADDAASTPESNDRTE
jgi:hypothetical protein